ncbi:hypothetical protein TCAL_00473 [Tigriopus californicus]|uniref:Ig-like domain-containing protein n=1 Tax=Tigriopus californicus TaxID=6832 RepID=A0A553NAX2_TIGCA|nr:hypothetical protein TCAL_00473 [Tigriopus californicus]
MKLSRTTATAKLVTWLRHFNPIPQLLALNNLTNIKDQRIKAFHTPGTEEFVLRIRHTEINDTGRYECQVAGKVTVSLFRMINLDVVEPRTEIIGGPDIYVDRGSTLNVTCAVSAGAQEPGFIFWSKQDKIVQFDGGETSKRQHLLKDSRGRSFSRLIIRKIDLDHAGRYTCQPESSPSQSVYVHVLNGTVLAVAADEGDDQQQHQQQHQQQQLPASSLGQKPSSPTSKVSPSQEKLPSNSEVSLASSSSKAQRLMATTTTITSWFGAPYSPWFSLGIQVSSSLMSAHLSGLIRTNIGN